MLYFDQYGKYLMTRKTRTLTQINIGMIATVLICVILGLALNNGFFGLAFGAFLAIIPIYQLDLMNKTTRKAVLVGFAILFPGLGAAIILASLMGAGMVSGLWIGLLISAVAFTWISSLLH